MISTLKIPRVAGTLMLALCGVAFHGAAQAIAVYNFYEASSSLTLKVTALTGAAFLVRAADQVTTRDVVLEQGNGDATNSPVLDPGGLDPLTVNSVLTNTADVDGKVTAKSSLASSDLETDLNISLRGPNLDNQTATITFEYTFDWDAEAAASLGYADATVRFRFFDETDDDVLIDSMLYKVSSIGGPSTTGGSYTGEYTVTLNTKVRQFFRFDVDAYGTAVPAPAPLALIAGGLLAMGASRRRAGAGQGL